MHMRVCARMRLRMLGGWGEVSRAYSPSSHLIVAGN